MLKGQGYHLMIDVNYATAAPVSRYRLYLPFSRDGGGIYCINIYNLSMTGVIFIYFLIS